MTAGRGLNCVVDGDRVLIGNERWMSENGIDVTADVAEACQNMQREAKTVVFVVINGVLVALLGIADAVKVRRFGRDLGFVQPSVCVCVCLCSLSRPQPCSS